MIYNVEVRQELAELKIFAQLMAEDFSSGCSQYSQQLDTGTDKKQDVCMANETKCPYYNGPYQTQGETVPVSETHVGIAPGQQLGFCRLQKDAIRIGPIILFDKGFLKRVR